MSTKKNKRKENRTKNKKSELSLSLGEEKKSSIIELSKRATAPIGVIASSSEEWRQTSQSCGEEKETDAPEVKNSPESAGNKDYWEAESDTSPEVGNSNLNFENNTT